MGRAGDTVDETIVIESHAAVAIARVLKVISDLRSHQVVADGVASYRLVRRYRPAWAAPLVFVKTAEECAMSLVTERRPVGAAALRLVGRLPRTTLRAVRLALEAPRAKPEPSGATPFAPGRAPIAAGLAMTPERSPWEPERPVAPTRPAPPAQRTQVASRASYAPSAQVAAPAPPARPARFAPLGPLAGSSTPPASPAIAAAEDPLNGTVPAGRARAARATQAACSVVFDTGDVLRVDGLVLVGRDPAPAPGEAGRAAPIADPDHSISKTHLALEPDAEGLWVTDRHSLNGTVIARADGDVDCPAGERHHVRIGETVFFGERSFIVRAASADPHN